MVFRLDACVVEPLRIYQCRKKLGAICKKKCGTEKSVPPDFILYKNRYSQP